MQLASPDVAPDRRHHVALARRAAEALLYGQARAARAALEAAADDMFVALRAAVDDPAPDAALDAAELAVALARLTEARDPTCADRALTLGLTRLDRYTTAAPTGDDALAWLLAARARVRLLHGDMTLGAQDATRAIALATSCTTRREALIIGAVLDREMGLVERGLARATEAQQAAREPGELAMCKVQIAAAHFDLGQYDAAHDASIEALGLARAGGAQRVEALAVSNLGVVAHARGDIELALLRLSSGVAIFEAIDDPLLAGKMRLFAALAALAHGQLERAAELVAAVVARALELGDKASLVRSAVVLARLDAVRGEAATGRARLEDALALARVSGNHRGAGVVASALAELAPGLGNGHTIGLRVGHGAYWFVPPGGERVELGKRAAPRRILAYLVALRLSAPGQAATTHELATHGWPGERMLVEAAGDRVYTAIGMLRRLGLDAVLVRRDGGYALDPCVAIVIS